MNRISAIETMPPILKGRSLDVPSLEPSEGQESVFDAVLYPNRSLPNKGFVIVMTIVAVSLFSTGLLFTTLGAWPVFGFCGLDIVAIWVAFKLSYRQGRLREHVRISGDTMWVSRVMPSGHELRWRLQPFWTRVHIDRPVRHESQVRVISKGGTLILGAFLSPEERERFADALTSALGRARG
ncbi:DUF2244 domain-containing protein [Hyphococcus lacteus]|uniref:DUF2244 domain-containing protein n=1 Tax=Hyphococcus lacteus TaxID=3143536 RepID=A0ABV3Z2W9_9PROT